MMIDLSAGLRRAWRAERGFTILDLGGLALGIATFLLLTLYARGERAVDRTLPGWDRVWTVDRRLQLPGLAEVQIPTTWSMLAELRAEDPKLVGARLRTDAVAVPVGAGAVSATWGQADPALLALFPLPVVAGDPAAALARPDGAIVTEHFARARFGGTDPLGRTLTVRLDGVEHPLRVLAVVADQPERSAVFADVLSALPAAWLADQPSNVHTFLRLDDAAAATWQARLPGFTARHPDPTLVGLPQDARRERLVRLGDLALGSPRDRGMVLAIALIGALALAVAGVNHVGLATAQASRRAREVALRKAFGATRARLLGAFMAGSFARAGLATLIGLALAELALPVLNAAAGTTLAIRYLGAGSIAGPLAVAVLAVGGVAGLVPALAFARLPVAPALAGSWTAAGSRGGPRARRALVFVQFAVAIGLMATTAVLLAQARRMRRADLGFDRAGLALVPAFGAAALDAGQRAALLADAARLPGVRGVAATGLMPGGGSFSADRVRGPDGRRPPVQVIEGTVGPGLLQLLGVRLLAGRLLDPDRYGVDDMHSDEAKRRGTNLVLGRTAARRLGFATPAAAIGRPLRVDDAPATVVGVIDDLRFDDPHAAVGPMLYRLRDRDLFAPILFVRFAPDAVPAGLAVLRDRWRRRAAAVPFDGIAVDNQLFDRFYAADTTRARLFLVGTGLALAVACLGLYALAAFDSARRRRELGIRKALGASTADVLRLLLAGFLGPVLLANLAAWPVALAGMRRWLAGFDDPVRLTPWFFLLPSLAAAAVAALTVLGHSWRAARAAPALALRQD